MRKAVYAVLFILLIAFPVGAALSQTTTGVPGVPSILSAQSIPRILPADGKSYNAIVISLEDSVGSPTVALVPITVFLASSLTNVGTVNSSIVIEPGHDYALATMTTTNTPGTTQITASAPGFTSSIIFVQTETPSGIAADLKVFAAPSELLSSAGTTGTLYVELQDQTGLPAKALTPTPVSLTSSDPNVASLIQKNITIPAGQIFTTVQFRTGLTLGSTTISAFSTGFTSGQGKVTVIAPAGNPATKVVVSGVLSSGKGVNTILPADGNQYAALELTLEDSEGNPVPAPAGGVSVGLTSTKSTVISVASSAVIPVGNISTIVHIQTSFLAGSINITAAPSGYSPSSAIFDTVIPAPSNIALFVAPSTKILTPLTLPLVVVQLTDASGNPARAKTNTSVLITSSNSQVVQGGITLTIPKGEDYAAAFLPVAMAGSTVLTAISSGLTSSQAPLDVVPLGLAVQITPSASTIDLNGTSTLTLTATLQGQPLAGANVTWISNDGSLTPQKSVVTTTGTVAAVFRPSVTGFANVTAVVKDSAIGVSSSTYFLTVNPVPKKGPLTLTQFIFLYGYLVILPLVVLLVFLVWFLRKRRKKAREELEAAFQTVG